VLPYKDSTIESALARGELSLFFRCVIAFFTKSGHHFYLIYKRYKIQFRKIGNSAKLKDLQQGFSTGGSPKLDVPKCIVSVYIPKMRNVYINWFRE